MEVKIQQKKNKDQMPKNIFHKKFKIPFIVSPSFLFLLLWGAKILFIDGGKMFFTFGENYA